ncbi:MAG TPA: WecB/TagA/CpsF family glycosyltransferase, partial [Anaerolineales bacterium]|nr:WecB/TagA/CpsF family glycosyltransferase [Anaerolineales bacterium]
MSYVNAHCLNIASRNQDYFQHLCSFDLIYPDGIGAVWAGQWLTGKRLYKMTGADWIFEFCQIAQANEWRIYILGGKPGVAKSAAQNLKQQFPALSISGVHDGYFTETERAVILDEIAALAPDVLFVGLGVPRQ